MGSPTDICNLALSLLGSAGVANIDVEDSEEARALKLWYPTGLDDVLLEADWCFARKTQPLALVSENPTDWWKYEFQLPADYIGHPYIPSGLGVETSDSEVAFEIVGDKIWTNQADAKLRYTYRFTNVDRMPAYFRVALAYRLAIFGATQASEGDDFELETRMQKRYTIELSVAKAKDANLDKPAPRADDDLTRSRA